MQTMTDRFERDDVAKACACLRGVLMETRGMGRRDFLAALGRAAAGSALLAPLSALTCAAYAADPPVTVFSFGGVWKKSMIAAFGDPFTQRTGIPLQVQDPYNWPKLRA